MVGVSRCKAEIVSISSPEKSNVEKDGYIYMGVPNCIELKNYNSGLSKVYFILPTLGYTKIYR